MACPTAEATDDDGVGHAVWVLDDPAVIDAITEAVAQSPVVIADGHHRYETALAYRTERRAAVGEVAGDYDAVMALVVELSEEQLSVGPIHRSLSGISGRDRPGRDVRPSGSTSSHAGPLDESLVDAVADSEALALVTAGGVWLLTPREETYDGGRIRPRLEPDRPGRRRASPEPRWPTTTMARRSLAGLRPGEAHAAVLLRPVTVAQIGEWAHARQSDAAQEHLLLPEATDRDGVPPGRRLRGDLRNWGGRRPPAAAGRL